MLLFLGGGKPTKNSCVLVKQQSLLFHWILFLCVCARARAYVYVCVGGCIRSMSEQLLPVRWQFVVQ